MISQVQWFDSRPARGRSQDDRGLTGVPTTSGVMRPITAHQHRADGARGEAAARKTNCQIRSNPGGAPVASLRVASSGPSRRKATAPCRSVQINDAAGTDTESSLRRNFPVSIVLQMLKWQGPSRQSPGPWQQPATSSQWVPPARLPVNWQCMVSGSQKAANHSAITRTTRCIAGTLRWSGLTASLLSKGQQGDGHPGAVGWPPTISTCAYLIDGLNKIRHGDQANPSRAGRGDLQVPV